MMTFFVLDRKLDQTRQFVFSKIVAKLNRAQVTTMSSIGAASPSNGNLMSGNSSTSMSMLPSESIQVIAEAAGVTLRPEVASDLAPEVEYRTRQIIQVSNCFPTIQRSVKRVVYIGLLSSLVFHQLTIFHLLFILSLLISFCHIGSKKVHDTFASLSIDKSGRQRRIEALQLSHTRCSLIERQS
jgi:hypothetical protein